jgi:hypothetical protein
MPVFTAKRGKHFTSRNFMTKKACSQISVTKRYSRVFLDVFTAQNVIRKLLGEAATWDI